MSHSWAEMPHYLLVIIQSFAVTTFAQTLDLQGDNYNNVVIEQPFVSSVPLAASNSANLKGSLVDNEKFIDVSKSFVLSGEFVEQDATITPSSNPSFQQ